MTNNQKKGILVAAPYITIIITIVGFYFGFDNIYQRQAEAAAEKQMTIQTFEMVQQQFTLLKRDSKIERLNMKIDYLTKHKYELKDQLRKYPGDSDLQEELNEVNSELKTVKEDLKQCLNKPILETD